MIKYGNQRKFYINRHIIDGLGMEFTVGYSERMPEVALTSFTVRNAYRYLYRSGSSGGPLNSTHSLTCRSGIVIDVKM